MFVVAVLTLFPSTVGCIWIVLVCDVASKLISVTGFSLQWFEIQCANWVMEDGVEMW